MKSIKFKIFSFKKTGPKEIITRQLTKKISIQTTKRRLFSTGVFTLLTIILVLCHTGVFFKTDVPCGAFLYIISLLLPLIAGILMSCKWNLSPRFEKALNVMSIWTVPLLTMILIEALNGVFIVNWAVNAFILNCIFYSLLYLAVYSLSGSNRLPFLIINPILFLLSLTNHYVFAFRGTPFVPMDFLYAGTAANVADAYDFSFNYQIIVAVVLFVFTQSIAWKIKTPQKRIVKKLLLRVVAGVLSFGILIGYYTSDFLADAGLAPDFFNQERAYHQTGVALNFWMNTKYLTVEKPKNYDASDVQNIVNNVIENSNIHSNDNTKIEKAPNIVCIMNESLSDLSSLGEVKTNKDYMPYLRSLTENTVKGNLYVPVIGAGTSNSEFEFLTGITTAFLPNGSNAYTLYVKNRLETLTSNLKSQGYSSRAFHPYFAENWNRPNVYNFMSFDKYDGMELFFNKEIMNAYSNGSTYENLKKLVAESMPEEKNVLLRHVVSDSYNYEKLIEMYEDRDKSKPFYIFNITMQNHGGYDIPYPDFNEEIYLVDDAGNKVTQYPKTNQYLSLIYESDKAFKELIKYFEAQDEPTIICMFGDHQPSIEDEYVTELLGAESIYSLDVKQTQSRYIAPFYIWANYDIEEKQIDKLSANYLSSYLIDIAGLEKNDYNKYLLALSEILPVIDTVGYIDNQNNYYIYAQETQYTDLINGYEKVCYNYLFDDKNKCDRLYDIKE